MEHLSKEQLKRFYENEAKRLSHQEEMYARGEKTEVWWHRKRLVYILSFFSQIFQESSVMTFVDVGCAEGFFTKYVASRYKKTLCVGVDIARAYVKKAKSNLNAPNTDYLVCDVENLPFGNRVFDLTLCSEVLEHVYDLRGSLGELDRITNRHLILSFPGHSYLYRTGLAKILFNRLLQDVGHVSEIRVADIQKILGVQRSLRVRIGGALPIMVFRLIPSIKIVDTLDNLLCKVLASHGNLEDATIHVVEMARTEN
jgi:2-polyprenyl-3-methyl-5-hydroxy-6-metoxy-1,4-benzoquinol methylase